MKSLYRNEKLYEILALFMVWQPCLRPKNIKFNFPQSNYGGGLVPKIGCIVYVLEWVYGGVLEGEL